MVTPYPQTRKSKDLCSEKWSSYLRSNSYICKWLTLGFITNVDYKCLLTLAPEKLISWWGWRGIWDKEEEIQALTDTLQIQKGAGFLKYQSRKQTWPCWSKQEAQQIPAGFVKSKGLVPLRRRLVGRGAGRRLNWVAPSEQAIIRPELAVDYMHRELYVPDLRGCQPWLTVRITCGPLKTYLCLGHTADQLNQNLQGWGSGIRMAQKRPRWPLRCSQRWKLLLNWYHSYSNPML